MAPADGTDDASMGRDEVAGDEGAVDGQGRRCREPAICVICHEPLRGAGLEVQMLECGHPWHKSCLEETWRVGGHEIGWCPLRCDVRDAAQTMAAATVTGNDVTTDSAGERETPTDGAEWEIVL